MAEQSPAIRKERKLVGAVEPVIVRGRSGSRRVFAKIDTGASRTTIDLELAAKVGLGPVLDTVRVRAAMSEHAVTRALVHAGITIHGEEFDVPVALTDRGDMRYHVIIGMDILKSGHFIIDPTKEPPGANKSAKGKFE